MTVDHHNQRRQPSFHSYRCWEDCCAYCRFHGTVTRSRLGQITSKCQGLELWSHCIKKGLEVVMDPQISLDKEEVEEESR